GHTITGQRTLTWLAGTTHTIATLPVQESGSLRNVFTGWSNGGAIEQTISPQGGLNLVAQFNTFVRLNTETSPAAAGTVVISPSSPDGYYMAGQTISFEGRPNPGFIFSRWAGLLTGSQNPSPFVVTYHPEVANHIIRANFNSTGIVPSPPRLGFVAV